jgi:hypothetical protein
VALTLSTAKPAAATTGTATVAGATTGNSSSTGLPEAAKKTIKLQALKKDDSNSSAAHAPTNGVFTLPKPGTPAGATAVQPPFVGPAEPDSSKSSRRIVKLKPPPGKGTTATSTAATAAPAFGPSAPSTFSLGGQSTPNKPFGSAVGFTAQPTADGIGAGGFTFCGGATEAGGFKFAAAPAPAAAAATPATAAAAAVEEVEEVVVPTGSNSVAVVYMIEGAATVLSGKGLQRVIVAGLLQLSAEITYHCVPGTDPAVYVKVRAATGPLLLLLSLLSCASVHAQT